MAGVSMLSMCLIAACAGKVLSSAEGHPGESHDAASTTRLAASQPISADASVGLEMTTMVEEYQRAYDDMLARPTDANIIRHAMDLSTGAERETIRETANSMARDQLFGRGHTELGHFTIRASRDDATVGACAAQEQVRIYHINTGRLAENPNLGVAFYTFHLVLNAASARWLIERVTVRTAATCLRHE